MVLCRKNFGGDKLTIRTNHITDTLTPTPGTIITIPTLTVAQLNVTNITLTNPMTTPITVMDAQLAAALGTLPNVSSTTVFGYIGALQISEVSSPISWGESRTRVSFLTSAAAMEIISSSASDTSAGTGARTVTVIGLDTNWDQVVQTVTMNGTTAVSIPTTMVAVNTVVVATAGSANSNVGNLTVRVVSGAVLQSYVAASNSISRMGMFTVPRNYKFCPFNFFLNANKAGGATATVGFDFVFTDANGLAIKGLSQTISNSTGLPITLPCPVVIGPKTRGELVIVASSDNGMNCSAGYTGILSPA